MSKRRNDAENISETEELPTSHSVQNLPPNGGWPSFDAFWSKCVRNGTPLLKTSFKAHLKALGWLNKPEKYVDGAKHFGIEMEKKNKIK
jgi:hypothetical protein